MPAFPSTLRRISSDFRTRLSSKSQGQHKDDVPRSRLSRTTTTQSTGAASGARPISPDDADVPPLDAGSSASDDDSPVSPPEIDWHDPLWTAPPPSYHDVVSPREARRARRAIVRDFRALQTAVESPQHSVDAPVPPATQVVSVASPQTSRVPITTSRIPLEEISEPVASHRDQQAFSADPSVDIAPLLSNLPETVWSSILGYAEPAAAASLALVNRDTLTKIGTSAFAALEHPDNKRAKIAFLNHFNEHLPQHLLCFLCAKYHLRLGCDEQLTASLLQNPVYTCPSVKSSRPAPRIRLTHDRDLPFVMVQLALRQQQFSENHGIPLKSLSKHWVDSWSGWDHRTKFIMSEGHLLMRVKSTIWTRGDLAPSELRLLLLDRTNYAPYFSVCQHWIEEGPLTNLCKCALRHIPKGRGPRIAGSCADCRPLRRCYHCPTEYLMHVKLVEMKDDDGRPEFRHALTITRWSDLGNDLNPETNLEWNAINDAEEYHEMQRSGDLDGLRTLRRRFEGQLGQRVPECRAVPLRVPKIWRSRNPQLWTEEQRFAYEQQQAESGSLSFPVLGGGSRGGSDWMF